MTRSRIHLGRGLRSTILLTLLLAALGLATAPASAQEGTIIDRSTTFNALADGQPCGDTCSDVSIHVSPDRTGTSSIVCLTVIAGETVEEGCANVAATFSMDTDNLAWAELAPTTVDLYAWVCDGNSCDSQFVRTVTVGASWSPAGDIVRHKETLGDHTGPCAFYTRIDGRVRDASVTATLDGASFTTTQAAGLQVIESTDFRRSPCA